MNALTEPAAEIEVRPIESADIDGVLAFFAQIPEHDQTFFREDVKRGGVVHAWLAAPRERRLIAVVEGAVVGTVAIVPGVALSSHVGELRLVVDPGHRRRGVGSALARRAVVDALDLGITKLVVEVIAKQDATVTMFANLGFEAEGLLKDHVKTRDGELHDVLVLSSFAEQLWVAMHTIGIDDAVLNS